MDWLSGLPPTSAPFSRLQAVIRRLDDLDADLTGVPESSEQVRLGNQQRERNALNGEFKRLVDMVNRLKSRHRSHTAALEAGKQLGVVTND